MFIFCNKRIFWYKLSIFIIAYEELHIMQKSYVRIYLKIDLFPYYLFWYVNKKLISYLASSTTWQMFNHPSDHLLKHVRNAAVGGGGYICFGQRPQHSWITGRLFMAQGRHSFLWPKATRFNESQVPPMAGKSGQIKFPFINRWEHKIIL